MSHRINVMAESDVLLTQVQPATRDPVGLQEHKARPVHPARWVPTVQWVQVELLDRLVSLE